MDLLGVLDEGSQDLGRLRPFEGFAEVWEGLDISVCVCVCVCVRERESESERERERVRERVCVCVYYQFTCVYLRCWVGYKL